MVKVEGGLLQGVPSEDPSVIVFKGIPYAAPPVGELRLQPPQDVIPWEGVRECSAFSAIAPQPGNAPGTFYGEEFYWMPQPEQSEDCLYLNIWAPAKAVGKKGAALPVAMWIHGGAFVNGYGFEVTLTRTTDKAYDLSLEDRGLMAKGADFFLSLHSNAAGASAQAVYSYCSVDGKSNKIGRMLSAAVASTMGVPDGGVINLYSDDGKTDYYCVLRNAAKVGVSGVMVEHSYHTNAYSREWLLKDSNLKKLAAAEAKAIAQYYGMI